MREIVGGSVFRSAIRKVVARGKTIPLDDDQRARASCFAVIAPDAYRLRTIGLTALTIAVLCVELPNGLDSSVRIHAFAAVYCAAIFVIWGVGITLTLRSIRLSEKYRAEHPVPVPVT
ncbi:hypothetical protein [Orlajensenia flava]|uniref:hypothetical protein n=1 Tax=Orlajensenia flava TaxID=2565934 RepID=UPI00145561A0|nr:hypothetical protein [Glaciibacter flavus]